MQVFFIIIRERWLYVLCDTREMHVRTFLHVGLYDSCTSAHLCVYISPPSSKTSVNRIGCYLFTSNQLFFSGGYKTIIWLDKVCEIVLTDFDGWWCCAVCNGADYEPVAVQTLRHRKVSVHYGQNLWCCINCDFHINFLSISLLVCLPGRIHHISPHFLRTVLHQTV